MNAEPARAYFGIGEVLARLRGEFPDVSVSKIRFLESEGLIEPARSPSGYRRFDESDIERLRYILTAQRDQYLPLRVIKERLVPPPADVPVSGSPLSGSAQSSSTVTGGFPGDGRGQRGSGSMSRRELLGAAGIDDGQLADLETFGLVRRVGRAYGRDALQAASAAGMLGRYGVEARHLRAVRAAAERETSLIEQLVAPMLRQRSPQARIQAGRTAREIAAVVLRLHSALIEAALAEAGFPGDGLPGDGLLGAGLPGASLPGAAAAGRPAVSDYGGASA
jgi:DNA-binding transcriptional MerR regulator